MTRWLIAGAFCCALAVPAFAAPRHIACDHGGCRADETRADYSRNYSRDRAAPAARDPRPAAWCGWWMRHYLGVADRAFNRAARWARYGTPAHGPHVGTVVVWPHHVGIITGHSEQGWIVKSGNDGHAVRERARSLKGAVAFRWPNGVASR